MSEQKDPIILDIGNERFKLYVGTIQQAIRELLNIYLGPVARGRLVDLDAALNDLVAARDRELRSEAWSA